MAEISCYDENTWEELGPKQVHKGQREKHERFCKMCVCDHASRDTAIHDIKGKFVKVKCGVRCRLVAQELGHGKRLDELFCVYAVFGCSPSGPGPRNEAHALLNHDHGREVCLLKRRNAKGCVQ